MKVRKNYEQLLEVLKKNQDKKVAEVLPLIEDIVFTKGTRGEPNYIATNDGEVLAMFCGYFKQWFIVVGENAVSFGKKTGTKTGYSTMSSKGAALWTQQNNIAKAKLALLLTELEEGKMQISDIAQAKALIAQEKATVVQSSDGYETKDQVIQALKANRLI